MLNLDFGRLTLFIDHYSFMPYVSQSKTIAFFRRCKYKINTYVIPLFILLIQFYTYDLSAQTIKDRYDLGFQVVNNCNWSWTIMGTHRKFLGENTERGKPALSISYSKEGVDKKMKFILSKTIIIPNRVQGKKLDVIMNAKCEVNQQLQFSVNGIDRNDKEGSLQTIMLNNTGWKKYKVSLVLGESKAFRISISYFGDSLPDQKIWLEEISLRIDGKDIGNEDYFSKQAADTALVIRNLKKNAPRPLSTENDSTLLTNIMELNHKKVFGIAQCTHGSKTVQVANYQFIKNLILDKNCRLVLLEIPIDIVFFWDLYVQGKIGENYKNSIEEDLKGAFGDYKLSVDFLHWLRKYNATAANKVHLVGIDNIAMPQLYLFDYHLALLGKDKATPYLKYIRDEKYTELANYAETDSLIKQLLDKQEFAFYISFLRSTLTCPLEMVDRFFKDRDLNMSTGVEHALNIYTKETETAAIQAHSGHLSATEKVDVSGKYTPLGYHLKKIHGDKFCSISFQIAEGSYTQDECVSFGANKAVQLPSPSKYSFEYAGLKTGIEYFYYPAKDLGDGILSRSHIIRGGLYRDLYPFSDLKNEFDAYAFIKTSKALGHVELFPVFYAGSNWSKKMKFMNAFFKALTD